MGLALLLPRFFRLDGLLYSFPISDALTFIIAAIIIRRTYRELTWPLSRRPPVRNMLWYPDERRAAEFF